MDINVVYRFLDKLHNRLKSEVEKIAFADTQKVLNGNISVVFYDMTTHSINRFLDAFDYFEVVTYNEQNVELNADETDAMVSFWIHFKGLFENSSEECDFKGHGCFKLKPSKYDGWDIYHIEKKSKVQ